MRTNAEIISNVERDGNFGMQGGEVGIVEARHRRDSR
jgi:hypothetical protein